VHTDFSLAQLADPDTAASEKILRACVHCGFCLATCPTYVLLGDELDSPRGRIYLIKNMLEAGGPDGAAPISPEPISPETVKHVDRCLSCLACMTTCPSGVNYMHLVDHGRRHIEAHYRRPRAERLLRHVLGRGLSRPAWLRAALYGARLAKPFAGLMPTRLRPLLALAPRAVPAASPMDRPQIFPAAGERRMRIALLPGCAQQVLAPEINEATIRLLTRHGCEVVVAPGSGCCGALMVLLLVGGVMNSGVLADPRPGATFDYGPATPDILERARRVGDACQRRGVPLRAATIQFPLAHPAVAGLIAGVRSVEHLDEYPAFMRWPIPSILWDDLRADGLIAPDAPTPA